MRQSGILLHISSLPGPEGIGTLGREAREFLRFLRGAGMSIWQVLPVGPTGYGESPYQSFSTFAGNPLFIDLRTLEEEGLLKPEALPEGGNPEQVDYPAVIAHKTGRLREAYQQSAGKLKKELDAFLKEKHWLPDYALFYALKQHFGGGSWMEWPDAAIRHRRPAAMQRYRKLLKEDIHFQVFVQYLFFRQWHALKKEANELGISLFGDMPIYVAMDSADCWAHPEYFTLSLNLQPISIAGVPPDYFSADGQLWGNPLYNWKRLKKDRYGWWIDRLRAMDETFDMLRVDHFIGFANYYTVRHKALNARYGSWRRAPGRDFFARVKRELPKMKIIAEDLGAVNPRVQKLLRFVGYPGMKVLSFAFTGGDQNEHLPQNVPFNCVYYTGTHDNNTARGWFDKAPEYERNDARRTLWMHNDSELCPKMVETVLGSRANRAMLPMQDLLGLPEWARMNMPGSLGGNWLWRMKDGAANQGMADWLMRLNRQYHRSPD